MEYYKKLIININKVLDLPIYIYCEVIYKILQNINKIQMGEIGTNGGNRNENQKVSVQRLYRDSSVISFLFPPFVPISPIRSYFCIF